MDSVDIIKAIEAGNLSGAKKSINHLLMSKIGPALAEKTALTAEALLGLDEEGLQEEDTKYQKFFKKALDKFGVSSPADFKSEEEKKKFFDYVDKNYKSDTETKTGKEDPDAEDEKKVAEGNEFSKALRTARKEGKKTFVVSGKEYTVEEFDEEFDEDVDIDIAKENEKVAQSRAKIAQLRKKKQADRGM